MYNAQKTITETVSRWDGVTAHSHRFGGTEYRLGRREIGHVHADRLLDVPFPSRVRDELVAAGRAQPHHVLPHSGWVSFYIRAADDIEQAVALLRQSYELALNQKKRRHGTE
jgi:predicted DNA-binding protein (MmcQ/YjbR family)